MLMASEETANKLRPISSAMSPEVWADLAKRALAISARLDAHQRTRFAEVYPDVTPHWHVVTVLPGQERTAAEELADRCFGVYLPESEHVEVRRGRKRDVKKLMLPGYVPIFVWDVDRHMGRIRACDGVRGVLMFSGRAAIVPDALIDRIRRAENFDRPLRMTVEVIKRRKRQSRKFLEERDVSDTDIIGVHAYSPYLEELRSESEAERLSAFHKAMGLPPCTGDPNQLTG